jgi:hypothetical protein
VRHAEPAPYHTRIAAGINNVSHVDPPKRASNPKRMKAAVAPVDFLASTLIRTIDVAIGRNVLTTKDTKLH